MTLLKFQHPIKEINGINCRVIEEKISHERAVFLNELLTFNNLETVIEEVPGKTAEESSTWLIATPDVTFNPIVKVYNRELKTPEGKKVTPDYWNQKTTNLEPNYWDRGKKGF
jgi:hypothetical protein